MISLIIIYYFAIAMTIHENISNLPRFKNSVITTGTFDGVHLGHHKIIDQVKKEAKEIKGESVLVTFNPHPRLILQGRHPGEIKLLTTHKEKLDLLSKTCVDHIVVVPFTRDFSDIEPDDYIADFLVKQLRAKCIITGYDHHFGRNRKGDFRLLKECGKKWNYSVKEIPEYVLEEVIISSTRIRKALSEGDIETANEFLGYDYFINGTVIHGQKLGKSLGFPTANIEVKDEDKLIPAYGIYIVGISIEEAGREKQILPGVMSIGIRPTIEDSKEAIEVYIFDFDEDLYGKQLRVHFKQYIRPEMRFDNLEQLKVKMQEDEKIAREYWQKHS